MGQYWLAVSLDKREFIDPHKLGAGLKLWEQVAAHPGTGAALVILCAAMPEERGGGDLDLSTDNPGYNTLAKAVIGRWAGDRIAIVGDYAEDSDLPDNFLASTIYERCKGGGLEPYEDISLLVVPIIEHELNGQYLGEGWKDFVKGEQ